jgi:hypothetical protein
MDIVSLFLNQLGGLEPLLDELQKAMGEQPQKSEVPKGLENDPEFIAFKKTMDGESSRNTDFPAMDRLQSVMENLKLEDFPSRSDEGDDVLQVDEVEIKCDRKKDIEKLAAKLLANDPRPFMMGVEMMGGPTFDDEVLAQEAIERATAFYKVLDGETDDTVQQTPPQEECPVFSDFFPKEEKSKKEKKAPKKAAPKKKETVKKKATPKKSTVKKPTAKKPTKGKKS